MGTISKVVRGSKILHQRLDYKPSNGFTMKGVPKKALRAKAATTTVSSSNKSLAHFIYYLRKNFKAQLDLKTPCPGSKYAFLVEEEVFDPNNSYVVNADDLDESEDDEYVL